MAARGGRVVEICGPGKSQPTWQAAGLLGGWRKDGGVKKDNAEMEQKQGRVQKKEKRERGNGP